MPKSADNRSTVIEALGSFLDQLRYARAAELARYGRFLKAEEVLTSNGRPPQQPHELDLLARIAAQQGQYQRAKQLWESALKIVPENIEFPKCIHEAERQELRQAWMMKYGRIGLFALAVAVLLALLSKLLAG